MPSPVVEAWVSTGVAFGVCGAGPGRAGSPPWPVFVVGIQPAASQPNDNEKKVRICHATSAEKNPYVSNEPAIANNGDLQGGHLDHTGPVFPAADWGDIIPPYTYTDQSGNEAVFPGRNWDAAGQAIW